MDRADRPVAADHRARQGGPYELIVRGPDGQPRSERFEDVRAYQARLAGITSADGGVSFDDLAGLLD